MRYKEKVCKAVFAVMFLGITMTGCSKNITPSVDLNNGNNEQEETKKVMSKEETDVLMEGQIITADKLKKLPDDLALENRNLTYVYLYTYLPNKNSNSESIFPFGHEIFEDLEAYGIVGLEAEEYVKDYKFYGIEITPIDRFALHDSTWVKLVKDKTGGHVVAGPVLSEEKIKELNAEHDLISK